MANTQKKTQQELEKLQLEILKVKWEYIISYPPSRQNVEVW